MCAASTPASRWRNAEAQLAGVLAAQERYPHVVDGRFKGGYITRHYGQPDDGIHAIQLEMTWDCYMDETPPYAWDPGRAGSLVEVLRRLVARLGEWRPAR